jgi:hypothetical protein
VPVLRWAALAWAAALLVPLGIVKAQEVPAWRGILLGLVAAALIVATAFVV